MRTAILGLLVVALSTSLAGGAAGQSRDPHRLAIAGEDLSAEAARELQLHVQAAPDDVDARTKLLGYYSRRAFTSKEARASRQQHVLWLIRHRPDAPILATPWAQLDAQLDGAAYREGKQAWLAQVDRQPKNPEILGRAAAYLLLHDGEIAESLYERAEAAEPHNPEWPDRLGRLHALGFSRKTGEDRQKAASTSLDAYERALEREPDAESRQAALAGVAKSAFEAGDLVKARRYAEEMLAAADSSVRRDWNYGNLIHHGHLILGRLALRAGDVKGAKEHLRAAGQTPGSPQLDSFGLTCSSRRSSSRRASPTRCSSTSICVPASGKRAASKSGPGRSAPARFRTSERTWITDSKTMGKIAACRGSADRSRISPEESPWSGAHRSCSLLRSRPPSRSCSAPRPRSRA
jgi:tetratricopeptide (TPR) repeat protein